MASIPPLQRRPGRAQTPASFGQRRLWFLDQMGAGAAYNIPLAVRLRGPLDADRLARSLAEVARRHETLRTTFAAVDGEPVQRIAEAVEVALPRLDLTHLAPDERESAALRLALAAAEEPFDLARGPLLRSALLQLGPDDHALLVTVHHIVWDRWSTGLLFRELHELGEAFAAGRPSPLAELPLQYADFALWQRDWLQGDVLERQLGYWRRQLAGLSPLALPTDRPRPAVQGYRTAVHDFEIPAAVGYGLERLSQRRGVTLAMVLLAGWQALLARLSGQEDIAVGLPISNRTRVELEPLIGFFVNTLVLRGDLSGDPSFGDQLLPRVRDASLGAYEHQDLPFEKLVEDLDPERDPSRHPLFQVMFTMQHRRRERLRLARLQIDPLGAARGAPELARGETIRTPGDLELRIVEHTGGLIGRLIYDTDLFLAGTIERMADRLVRLLAGVAARPLARLWDLPVLDERERHRLRVVWNDTRSAVAPAGCAHEMFEARARERPRAIALVDGERQLTFEDLDSRAGALARALVARGVRVGDRVALCLERSAAAIAGLLGVLKAGGAYVPLDPADPRERLALLLRDVRAAAVLTREGLREAIPAGGAALLCVDGDGSRAEGGPLARRATADEPAYAMYTSGSTGVPKAVVGLHRGIVNRIRWEQSVAPWQAGEVACQKTALGFVDSVCEILGPLVAGIPLVIVPNEAARDPLALIEQLGRHGVTRIVLVPSLLAAMLESTGDLGRRLPRLRRWTASGEPLSRQLAERFRAQVPGATLWNLYGSTEVAADATFFDASAERPNDPAAATVPIGRPLANVRAYVLDRRLQLLPAGVPGELYVGGAGLARGYFNRPAWTAERFLPDPVGEEPGARLYATGDLARVREDGALEFLGRLDGQEKLRGIRIELGEVEAVLAADPAVAEVVCRVRRDRPGDERLVAYAVPRDGSFSTARLLAAARERLPGSLVPTAIVGMAALPRTASGKVDRQALPAPDRGGREACFVAPRSGAEEVLCAIWSDVLGADSIGVHDDFFDLGGHSLLATRVVARIRVVLACEVKTRDLFVHRTVAALAAYIENRGAPSPSPPLVAVERDGPLPLSFAQERMWFFTEWGAGVAYNLPLALRLRGALHRAALEQALAQIVRRHETLRTRFERVDGRPVQRIVPPPPLAVDRQDLRALAPGERQDAVLARARQEADGPFDLASPPLLRAALLELDRDEHVLLLTLPHAVADGWSLGVLLDELARLYEACAAARPSPLAALPVQYADFAVWQRSWLAGAEGERQLAYWRPRLAGLAPLVLPTDRPRPAAPSYRAGEHPFRLPAGVVEALQELARRQGATLAMVLLAAWQALLARASGQEDVAVGVPIANRTRLELEPLIGFFVNTLVIRGDLSGDPSFGGELLARVKDASLAAYEHQDIPFERLVQALDPRRDARRHPLFQVLFALQNAPRQAPRLAGLTIEELSLPTGRTGLDLELRIRRDAEGFAGRLLYDVDLFEAATIERMATRWTRLLAGIAADPWARLSRLSLFEPGERRRLFRAWSEPAAEPGPAPCAFQLFEERARRQPDRIAVECEGRALSCAALDRRANRLAHHLIALGLGAEERVGVAVERSLDLLACLLAIHKAGGAYLPLDPQIPAERLAYMIADAAPRVILTETALAASLPASAATQVAIDEDAALADRPGESPGRAVAADQLAYVIYTSGSTGRPKGVLVQHASLVNFLASARRRPGLAAEDVFVAVTSLSFDIAGLELFLPLVAGARVVIVLRATAQDPRLLVDVLERVGATICQATPTGWQALLLAGWRGDGRLRMLAGGEALSRSLANELLARGGELWNLYGPTETTIYSAVERVEPGDGPVPIGRPVAGTQLLVLEAALRPLPPGMPGELFIGGGGVARGYRNRPALTAERFVPSPWPAEAPGRLYRTGDRVRIDAQGRLLYLGRQDEQVKLRGFRIEPGEIESVLGEHPGVAQAAVTVAEAAGDRRLVAHVVAAPGHRLDGAGLRAFLERKLPESFRPSTFVFRQELPVSAAGKVDRRALAALPVPAAVDDPRGVAPRDPTEEVVAALFREVLGGSGRAGAHDDFFALGGHSLLAIRLAARLRDVFRVELPLRQLFASPTVAGLARWIAGERRADRLSAREIRPAGRDGPLPLSFPQRRLWVLDQMGIGAAYNLRLMLDLAGPLDRAALEAAVQGLAGRHETLRTRFGAAEGVPFQLVEERAAVPFEVADLAGVEPAGRRAAVDRLAARAVEAPFDLGRAPLLRSTLARLEAERHVLILVFHHIVADGWSLQIAAREIAARYRSRVTGEAPGLAPLPVQFADFAVWQQERLAGPALAAALAAWRECLAGELPVLDLPADRPRPPVQTFRGASHRFALDPPLAAAVGGLARSQRVTLATVCLSAFQALLARLSGEEDVVVGSPIAGRTHSDVENLVGCFANSVVLRTDLAGDPTVAEALARTHEVVLAAHDHQEVPFERLLEAIRPSRDPSRTPLFQVVFALQDVPEIEIEAGGLVLRGHPAPVTTSRYDLELYLQDRPDGMAGQVVYNPDLFDATTVEALARRYRTLLAGFAGRPDERLSRLPLLDEAERRRLLGSWSTGRSDPAEAAARCVHSLFAARAAERPAAVAVVHRERSFIYREIDEESNRLAHFLLSRGVGPEARVGLCLQRGPAMIIGLLGVLKAGGAYVPLDPDDPPQRLAFLVADAGVGLLLTEGGPPSVAGAETIRLDADAAAIRLFPARDPGLASDPGDLAYAIYTSGSTGVPKAALLAHRGLANVAREQARAFGVGPGSRVLQFAPLTFDAATFEISMALTRGATLVLGDPGELAPGPPLLAFLARQAIAVATLPPSALAALPAADLPQLATVLVAGEACPPDLVARWAAGRRFFNLYGPTEATIWSTAAPLQAGDEPVIGRPIGNTQAYVLDRHLEPVPAGTPGEIYLGGSGIARGYQGRAALTAERFVPNPFRPGERLLRTGDRARLRRDGAIEFLGRLDDQIKLRGQRIEPGEVEAALLRHPRLAAAAVAGRGPGAGEAVLTAWVVPAGEGPLPAAELRDFLGTLLPPRLIPAQFVPVAALPRTRSGKLDRRALPDPPPPSGAAWDAPQRPTERCLAAIWAEALALDRVGRHDNFFDLGGHSFLALAVLSRIERDLRVPLRPADLLFKTLSQLAAQCEEWDRRRARRGSRLLRLAARWRRRPAER